ncbi:hypothetical protein PEX1_012520 [Penicillium expansum]|uniref:Transcription factor, fungi n=1 Tax=Penicillium expansum TaxID=27334 RepID=A0A0A2JVB7_PENEN|nr:hypothetical protein PEX2_073620 [Penicillium expansum]KGO36085.1 hypothetical protein PEXP_076040 [Penicillium expansum]KGO41957.1 hypothetical protein PEX1_012520 [Penicillium expansum]KGO59407.1 hypothetical protein PEX2_073620 [Penicillium expansum]
MGMGIRLAQSLDLQNPLASHVGSKEAEICGWLWWMLLHLDFRCSRYLGKPIIVPLRDTTLAIPKDNPSSDPASSELVFHFATITLTVVGKKVAESLTARLDTITTDDSVAQIEHSAEHLTDEITNLYEWKNRIVKTEPFKDLVLVGSVNRPQTHTASEGLKHDDRRMLHQSPTRILQQTLLELQFHDLIIWFHRPFIQFPSLGLVPQRSPGADIHATTALRHALKAIEIVHRRMLNHDAFMGAPMSGRSNWGTLDRLSVTHVDGSLEPSAPREKISLGDVVGTSFERDGEARLEVEGILEMEW